MHNYNCTGQHPSGLYARWIAFNVAALKSVMASQAVPSIKLGEATYRFKCKFPQTCLILTSSPKSEISGSYQDKVLGILCGERRRGKIEHNNGIQLGTVSEMVFNNTKQQ